MFSFSLQSCGRMAISCFRPLLAATLLLGLGASEDILAQENAPADVLNLRADKPYLWWSYGDKVTFKLGSGRTPADLKTLEGRIADVSDRLVETVSIDRAHLESPGWQWQPKSPGFYNIEFSWKDSSGKSTSVVSTYYKKAPNGVKGRFDRKQFSVAITNRPDPNLKPTRQFGFHYHLDNREIPLAQLIGYDFAFIHSIPWGNYYTSKDKAVEPEKGVYNWTTLDTCVKALTNAGFEIAAQFLYTPVWASPHPERSEEIAICLPVSSAFAPKDMNDFTDFVEKTVTRYKDRIKIWEIWNEPNMPNGSIYWFDTPENYVRLLEAGYKAVKKVQPEAEVWNGGIGMRLSYHTFYDRILQGGAAPYYDKLSLHGVSTDVSDFRRIEVDNNAPHKEAVMSEWHAILVGNMSAKLMDTEAGLSMRMMRDQLSQIKQGVTKTVIFEITNQSEKETTNFAIANNWFTHSSGLFRLVPRIEPRHPALVMATFIGTVGKKASFEKEILIGQEGYGLLLSTGRGRLLAFWSETLPIGVSDVKKFLTTGSVLTDWEGKNIKLDGSETFELNKIYYLSEPDESALKATASADRFVPPGRAVRSANGSPTGTWFAGKVLDNAIADDTFWISNDWKYTSLIPGGSASANISARALVGVHEEGIDLVVEVVDPKHVQNEKDKWWNGDSLQVAIDCEGRGLNGGNMEIVTALKPDGTIFWKTTVANAGADLPAEITGANAAMQRGESKITREGEKTIYRVRLPWSELYPLVYDPKRDLKLTLLVNDNNGEGRAGYLEWAGGIASIEKDPMQYGTLKPPTKP